MGSERPARAEVGRPEFVTAEPPSGDDTPQRLVASWFSTMMVIAATGLLGFVLLTGQAAITDPSPSESSDPSPELPVGTSTVDPDRRVGTRTNALFDEPVLDVSIGAILISTDFDGRITALDLDAGVLTRTSIRTGAFVTVDGELVVQTGCGAWRTVETPEYTLGEDLIGCGSFQPMGRRGAEAVLFTGPEASGVREVVMADGAGGVVPVPVPVADVAGGFTTVGNRRVLIQNADRDVVWIEPDSGESTHYADGELIASGPGGVLWANCRTSTDCEVWSATADEARVNRYAVESRDGEFLARINNRGSRAVFFLSDDILRIVTLETGHAREIVNPGIEWSTATWSPDGLWLFDPTGAEVVALNTLNGRSVRFDGIPGDVSPGWVALIEGS